MMKQTVYKLLLICLTLSSVTNLCAQSVECSRNFEIKTKITPSTCMANGIIEVTLEGDLSELDMARAEYGLEPSPGTTGTTLLPSTSNVLRGIAPGKYTLNVRTFCHVGDQYGRVKEVLEINVEGTYKPLMADFDQARSRKSYKECATGIIGFNLIAGTGFGDLKFYITKAPQGVTQGEILPTKNAVTGNYIQYTLPGFYPSGQYQIDIDDNCGKSTISFTLDEMTALPTPSASYTDFRPVSNDLSCNSIQWSVSYPNAATNPDYYRYYADRMYEVALVPNGVIPAESDWVSWNSSTLVVTLPGVFKDYYPTSSLAAFVRLKDCSAHISNPYLTKIGTPYLRTTTSNSCDYASYGVGPWNDRDGILCYPLLAKVINRDDGTVVHTETLEKYSNGYLLMDYQYQYNTNYTVQVTDNSMFTITSNHRFSFNPYPDLNVSTYKCDKFTGSLSFTNTYKCYPVIMDTYKLKDGGDYNNSEDFEPFDSHTFEGPSGYSKAVEWDYGSYMMVSTYPKHQTEDGKPFTQTRKREIVPNRPTAYNLSVYSPSVCEEDMASLYIRSSAPSSGTYFPIGTTFTVVEAPVGYPHVGVVKTATSSSYYYNFNQSYLPAGKYRIAVNDGCGAIIPVEATLNGGYSARNTKFIVESHGCEGERLKLDGLVTNAGINQASYTYYQIISGPKGFDPSPKSYNQSTLLMADGEYIVGVKTSSSNSCYLRRDTIRYAKSKPTLNTSITSSYVCTDRKIGYIIVSGQDGTKPYTYDLLNEDKTSTGAVPTDAGDGRVYFDYGAAGQTFFVRIIDACGNYNDQEIKLTDLETQRIIYNTPPSGEYCLGDTIKLNCITLGETSYLWKGPNGFVSNEQNPRLFPATEAMTGYYSVSVMPEFCGESVTDQLYIKVFPALVPGTVSSDQEICVATLASAMSCTLTGGKGLFRYQWQLSTDRINWTNISGADRATYTPSVFTRSGAYYYRLQIIDDCATAISDVITLNVKPCYIMVNPNIRSKPQ